MTENDSTNRIAKNTFEFGGETFLNYSESLQEIQELSQAECAVIGVELFEWVGKSPKWIATSNYDHTKERSWEEYCLLCHRSAEEFIKKNKGQKNGLFTFMTMGKTEFTK